MKRQKATVTIARGYAATSTDERRLRELGVKTIYLGYKGETPDRFKMRKGELLAIVGGLRAFGEARRDMVAAIKRVHDAGAAVIDLDTDLRSDRDGVEMLHKALSPKGPSPEFAAEMQARSVRVRVKGRMDKRSALTIWRNPKFSTAEAIELMTGWKQATAYTQLGRRDVPAGRRAK